MESRFLSEIEKEFSELLNTGKIEFIEEVKRITTKHFYYNYPIYFMGNMESKLVLVSFNSSRAFLNEAKQSVDFHAYKSRYQNIGKFIYEDCYKKVPKSQYLDDIKEYQFIKPFQVIKFERGPIHSNLQKLIDEKLHLDLVPYSTPDFSSVDFINNYVTCKPFIDRLLDGIFAHPRRYVIFMGDFFLKILSEYITSTDRFIFEIRNQAVSFQSHVVFTRVTINYQGRKLIAGIADSFNDELLDESMMEQYGEAAANIINRGIILSNTDWSRYLN